MQKQEVQLQKQGPYSTQKPELHTGTQGHTGLMLGRDSNSLLQQAGSGVGSCCLVVLHVGLSSEACHDVLHAEAPPTPCPTPQHGVAGTHYLGVAAALPQLSKLPHQAPGNAAARSHTGVSLVGGGLGRGGRGRRLVWGELVLPRGLFNWAKASGVSQVGHIRLAG